MNNFPHWPPLDFSSIGKPFLIADGFMFTEGPVWNRQQEFLLFSDIAGNTIYRWTPSNKIDVIRRPSGNANGLAYDLNGDLLAAEHGSRTLTRMSKDGTVQTVASHWQEKKLHSPNDIAVRSDGTIYFTDPPYGLNGRTPELDFMGLYRITPDGRQILEGKYNQYLNGLAFSPDEKTMYLALTEADLLLALDVADDGATSNPRRFAEVTYPDGIAVDIAGNIYVAGWKGIAVLTPEGNLLGTISTDRPPANCAFAGADGKLLVMTARDCLLGVQMPIPGF